MYYFMDKFIISCFQSGVHKSDTSLQMAYFNLIQYKSFRTDSTTIPLWVTNSLSISSSLSFLCG